ncbi:MAG: hypothetical protein AAF957_13880 [Planctomycetota bacterium]
MDSSRADVAPSAGAQGRAAPSLATPRLEGLLDRLRSTLLRSVWLHGLGTVVAAAAAWLFFMYAADRLLKLPAAIRIFHAFVLTGGTVYLLQRTFVRHVRSVPDREGLAILAQRALPGDTPREDLFVSALQLPASVPADAPARELVASVTARAEELAGRADLGRITDAAGPRGRLAAALGAVALLTVTLSAEPAMAKIFAARMLGADVPWPRATTLYVSVPADAPGLEVRLPDPETVVVRAARGSDIPLLVRAEGVVPAIVTATFDSGAAIDIGATGPDTFRTIIPSVQEPLAVRVTGGDDQRGVPVVRIDVLEPPDITALAFAIEPPEYTGLPRRIETDTKVTALAGSRVTVHVETDPSDATGIARTFPDDRVVDLVAAPFPVASTDAGAEAPAERAGLSFEEIVDQSLRFRIELRDSSGLENPDPALFGIEVVPDRRPELIVLAPGRAEAEVVEGGVLPLRVLVRDDFGVGDATWEARDAATDAPLRSAPFTLRDATEALEGAEGRARVALLGSELLEVATLSPEAPLVVGQMVVLASTVRDTRAPDPNESKASPILVRVVSADEFLRGQRDGLGRAAEEVERLDRRLEQTGRQLGTFVSAMSGDDAEIPEASSLVSVTNEARRLQGDLRSVARDLSGLAADMVYSRLDGRSAGLEARLVELTFGSSERSFQEDAWRAIADELSQGGLGSPERAGDLVRIVGLALQACGPRSEDWIASLEGVRASSGIEETRVALADATQRMQDLRATMDQLMGELGEWDSLQSILSLTRDILSRQKNLNERTRKTAETGK